MANGRCQFFKGSSAWLWSEKGKSSNESYKRGLNTKRHLAVDVTDMPVRAMMREGTTPDCSQISELMEGIRPHYLLADRGYDTNEMIEQANQRNRQPVIPPKRNRIIQRPYHERYSFRHRVEKAFLYLKQWGGIATRYAKNARSLLASIHIRCFFLGALLI